MTMHMSMLALEAGAGSVLQGVLVVSIMFVLMFVLEELVFVRMLVPFCQVQDDTDGHQHARHA